MSEIITAVFTIVLAVATVMLWSTTRLLAKNTKEDFTRRKIHDTVAAWGEIRNMVPTGGFPMLDKQSQLHPDHRAVLRKMEYFAACVNSEVYDFGIFERISGGWSAQQYTRIRLYIESRPNPRAYSDLRKLYSKISAAHAGNDVSAEDDETEE